MCAIIQYTNYQSVHITIHIIVRFVLPQNETLNTFKVCEGVSRSAEDQTLTERGTSESQSFPNPCLFWVSGYLGGGWSQMCCSAVQIVDENCNLDDYFDYKKHLCVCTAATRANSYNYFSQ